jgi:hypothetical protein
MTATIKTNAGEYTGNTVESIVRREYGRKAYVLWTRDPNNPHSNIVRDDPTAKPWGAHVLDTLLWWEGDREDSTYGDKEEQ